ncbi:MAG TPA: hypothetical protein VLG47_03435 [Candidatus Saccharimonadales bacterium]|nr:hypothetical protein [Candidatus Saccharimonadales bacterium]
MISHELISRRVNPAISEYIVNLWGRISYVWSYDTACPKPEYRPIPQDSSSSLGQCGPANYMLARGLSYRFPETNPRMVIYGKVRLAIGGVAIRDHGWALFDAGAQNVVGDVALGQLDMPGQRSWDIVCVMPESELAEKGVYFEGGREYSLDELWEHYNTDPLCREYEFAERIWLLEHRLVEEFSIPV